MTDGRMRNKHIENIGRLSASILSVDSELDRKADTAMNDFYKSMGTTKLVTDDNVNHPKHYTEHPSGIECIQIVEHMDFNIGNAVKYLWRCDLKKDAIEDLRKAVWYVQREIEKRELEKSA